MSTEIQEILAALGVPSAPKSSIDAAEWRERHDREAAEEFAKARAAITTERRDRDLRTLSEWAPEATRMALRDPKRTQAVEVASRWLRGSQPILVLCGPPGCGKTVAACWAAAEAATGEATRVRCAELIGLSMRDPSAYTFPAFVVMDDWRPRKTNGDHFAEAWFDFVDARIGKGRAIVTTNYTRAEFLDAQEPHTLSRLRGHAAVAGVTGEDMRGQP